MENSTRISKYLAPELLAAISNLTVRTRNLSEGTIEGRHKSPYKGFNVEFSSYRQYAKGDPVKDIDWKVYARSDKLYIKEHEQETNLNGYIILDSSTSMNYKGDKSSMSKYDYAATLAASFAYLILKQQDSLGLAIFSDQVQSILPSRGGMQHLKTVCNHLEQARLAGKTDIASAIDTAARAMRKRGLFIIISDLMDNAEATMEKLRQLKTAKHEVVLYQVLDSDELFFPFDQPAIFRDMETNSEVTVDAFLLKNEYRKKIETMISAFRNALRKTGIDYILTDTSNPPIKAVKSFFTGHSQTGRSR